MSDQTIFGTNNQQETPVNNQQPPANNENVADLLSLIRNENGEQKYKTVKDAIIGLQHAQNFIQTLKTEKSQMEQEVSSLRPVAEKVTELEKVVLQLTQKPNEPATTGNSLSEESIAQLVEQTLTKKQQEEVAKKNIQLVSEQVKGAFGEKAEEIFYSKAQEIGLSRAEMNALAARTPMAALKLIGITETKNIQNTTPSVSSINTAQLTPNQETFVARNNRKLEVGATAQEIMEESALARKMVTELHEKGMSIDDLTKPSVYFKYFK